MEEKNQAGQEILSASQEHEIRLEKVKKLREQGIEPWPEKKEVRATARQVLDEFNEGDAGQEYTIAGRLVAIRGHGKTVFAKLQDRSGQIQIYLKKDELGDQTFDLFINFIDIGDIVWVKGV